MNEYLGANIETTYESLRQTKSNNRLFERRAILFMAFINVGKLNDFFHHHHNQQHSL